MSEDFARQLIKGKIAEQVFELMFREAGEFNVFHSGYEFTEEYLAQHRDEVQFKKVLKPLSSSPDFLLVSNDNAKVFLVEVKYRSHPQVKEIISIAQETLKRWDHAYIFLATPTGFHFEPAHRIVNSGGDMPSMPHSWANADIQEKYLALLNEFIR